MRSTKLKRLEAREKIGMQLGIQDITATRQRKSRFYAIQLAKNERLDVAWRKMHALRWRMLEKHLLPPK
jgi:hypothetical protein